MTQAPRNDLAILGAGVTGLAAAMYAGRLNLRTVVLGNAGEQSAALDTGGTITMTDVVENYPGFPRITGEELASNFVEHASAYPGVEIRNAWIDEVTRQSGCFRLKVGSEVVEASALLFATGTRHRELAVPGHDRLRKKGVHYCALCDGPLYKGKTVAVVGGSDSAAKEALLLAEHAERVLVLLRGAEVRAEPVNRARIEKNPRIAIVPRTNITRLDGDKRLDNVALDQPFEGADTLKVDAVFVAIGVIPLSELAEPLGVQTNDRGEIVIDRDSRTNVAGIYAAGDVADRNFKQAITGAAEGVVAAYSAFEDLTNEVVCPCDDRLPAEAAAGGQSGP